MCHIIKVPLLANVKTQDRWIFGWKEIVKTTTGALQAPVIGTLYSPIELENGFVLHDREFGHHNVQVWVTTPTGDILQFDVNCKPGLYANLSPHDVPRGWAVAAKLEWVSLISDTGFSSHTLLCTKPAKRMPKLIKEYTSKARDIWQFEWRFTRRKSDVLSPIYGCHPTAEGAVAEAFKRLDDLRPLSQLELDILKRELDGYPSYRSIELDVYAEIRSPLWMK